LEFWGVVNDWGRKDGRGRGKREYGWGEREGKEEERRKERVPINTCSRFDRDIHVS
jgi:hypothetical protein